MTHKNNTPKGYKVYAVGIIPKEWEVEVFHKLGYFLRTNTLSRDKMNNISGCAYNIHYGDILIKYGEILNCTKTIIPQINIEYINNNLGTNLQNGDIIISDTAEDYTVGKATEIQNINNKKIVSGLHTIAFRPNTNIFVPYFLGYYFNSPIYNVAIKKVDTRR